MSLEDRIKGHEGCVTKPYYDSEGILTAAYGRNLEAVPFSQDEMDLMFRNDLQRAIKGAESFSAYESLNRSRRGVLIEMTYQMGVAGVNKFKKFLAAAEQQEWQQAHDEMLDSKWHDQTPERAQELAGIFLGGEE